MKQTTIRLNKVELEEIATRAVKEAHGNSKTFRHELAKQFDLIRQMEVSRPSSINRGMGRIFLFAGCAFAALAIKIFCESYWGIH